MFCHYLSKKIICTGLFFLISQTRIHNIPYILAYKSTPRISRMKKKSPKFCPKFLVLYASIYGYILEYKSTPRISRMKKKSPKFCPKFLVLYASIYGNWILRIEATQIFTTGKS